MVDVVVGNLFDSDAQTIVNTVNCVGVMGKGIALEFKKRFPAMYKDYVARCARGEVRLGQPYLYSGLFRPWILNFPTKDNWRSLSKLSDIEAGLEYLTQQHRVWGLTSLAVPPLGCGNGGLLWSIVGPTLYQHLARLDIPVELYAPLGTPAEQLDSRYLAGKTTVHWGSTVKVDTDVLEPAWVGLAAIIDRIDREPYHWPTGRVILQKLAYFATREGIPTGLSFVRGSYGPFAAGLNRVTSRLVNHGVLREQQRGRTIAVTPGPSFSAVEQLYKEDLKRWQPQLDRVADLFLRMDSRQAEIAGTVSFVADELAARQALLPSENAVFDEVRKWKLKRRPSLHDEEVAAAIRGLGLLGWLDARPSEDLPVPADTMPGA